MFRKDSIKNYPTILIYYINIVKILLYGKSIFAAIGKP